MSEAKVQLKVAGQNYQVVTSADPTELAHLASMVEEALVGVTPPGRQPSSQALVLAAITLAHELEEERAKRKAVEERHRRVLKSLLERVDQVLDETAEPALVKTRPSTSSERPSSDSQNDSV